jgi:2-oxoglutarate-Fe(II)-dependent oxygenase superfamily protein
MEVGLGDVLKLHGGQRESFTRDGYVVVHDALPEATITRWRERAHELFSRARHIDQRSDRHVLAYRVLTGDVIREEYTELYDFYVAPSTLRWVAGVTGEREIHVSSNLRSAVNVNILQSGNTYRWHFDANPFTALLYLSTTPPGAGGELELYPNLGPQNTSPEDLAARQKVVLPTRANTLVLMDGTTTYHHVAPVIEECDRLSVPMVYPPFRDELRPPELDDYLYGSDS